LLLAVPTLVMLEEAPVTSITAMPTELAVEEVTCTVIEDGDEGATALQVVNRADGPDDPLVAVPLTSSVQVRLAVSLIEKAAGTVAEPMRAMALMMISAFAVGVKESVVTVVEAAVFVTGLVSPAGLLTATGYSMAASTASICASIAVRVPLEIVVTMASSSPLARPCSHAGLLSAVR